MSLTDIVMLGALAYCFMKIITLGWDRKPDE